ncbi:MAG: hypothetical protein FWH50_01675, partial [Coriobacteriia bacterium]|nr:hypothetical protein [Coriobacteriia bacterium]
MKAIIISHEDDGSYVMDREGSFRFVKGYSSRPVGMEIEIAAKAPTSRMRLTAIAASFFLVLALTGFAWTWNTQKYSVYMDINPSLELVFNGFDRLIAVNALNEDGETLLRDLNLRGMPGDAVL